MGKYSARLVLKKFCIVWDKRAIEDTKYKVHGVFDRQVKGCGNTSENQSARRG